jgi:hypothetical protein
MASAVQLYEQVRGEYVQVFGAGHRDTLNTSVNLAHALYAVGRLTDAAKLLRDTAERCELHLPADDPITVKCRESLHNVAGTDPLPAAGGDQAARQPADPEPRPGIGRRMAGRHRTGR